MYKISVVILNWNGEKMLKEYLPSVVKYSGDAEVCVADNASTDNSVEMLKKEFPNVRVEVLDHNYGFAEGYNQALRRIDAEYFVLLNSDVEVTENWLVPMANYLDAHPETAACQPKLLSATDHTKFEYSGAAGGYIDSYGYPFCRGRIFNTVETDNGQYDDIVQIMWATGAALMVRANDYRKEGGLDSRFFAHMEEIDFCWRLRSRGRGIVCIPQSKVYHVGGATLPAGNPKKTFLNFRNNLLMIYKNAPDEDLERMLNGRFWLDTLAMLVFIAKFQFANAKAVYDARKEFSKLKSLHYRKNRQWNMSHITVPHPEGWWNKSILSAYHFKRIKKFTDLNM